MNAAFIYKHIMAGEVLIVDMQQAKQLDAARGHWQLIHSVNAVETLSYIIGLTPRHRTKYIKQLTEQP